MALEREALLGLYTTMVRIRRFEERVASEFYAGNIPGFVHSYIGQEAIATGVCAHLTPKDRIVSHHRGHGHCIAKGADMRRMMAEIYGKSHRLLQGQGRLHAYRRLQYRDAGGRRYRGRRPAYSHRCGRGGATGGRREASRSSFSATAPARKANSMKPQSGRHLEAAPAVRL